MPKGQIDNSSKKSFLLNMPKALDDKLKILMIEHMHQTQTPIDFTNYLLYILYSYVKEHGSNVEQIQRSHIINAVDKAKRILDNGKVSQQIATHWIEQLRPYRLSLNPDDELDREVALLINSFEKVRNPNQYWKNLEVNKP